MESRGYAVNDVSNNPDFWSQDIDFVITSPSSNLTKTFEVKYDSKIHSTNNLYLEITNIYSRGGKGWFEFCEADYLVYGDAAADIFYVIPLLELRERVKQLPSRQARCGYESTGLLVSLKDIADITEIL